MNKKQKDAIFVYGWLAWPILHFFVFWFCMNFGTVIDSFFSFNNDGSRTFEGIKNYAVVFKFIFGVEENGIMNHHALLNTFSLMPISLLINLPITIFFAYCIYKKIIFAKAFEIILFVPAILSATILCLVFKMSLASAQGNQGGGIIYEVLKLMNLTGDGSRFDTGIIPTGGFLGNEDTMWTFILIFSVWTGVNGNLIYFQSAIARLPDSVFESSELDGASEVRQFFSICLPLVWPTITTMSITLVGGVFGWMMPSILLTGSHKRASTVAMIIANTIKQDAENTIVCALSVVVAVFGGLFIMGFKTLMEKVTEEVEY